MVKLIIGKQYQTIYGLRYFEGTTRNDYTCDICHKQHRKGNDYQTLYEFTDTGNNEFSYHELIGTTCIKKYLKS